MAAAAAPDVIGALLDADLLPEAAVRFGIRRLLATRLAELEAGGPAAAQARSDAFLAGRQGGPVAVRTDASRRQHYEVPTRFFELVLGPRLKYSGAWWHPGVRTLAEAETAMLDASIERAGVADGHRVLDLGCGWGALTFRVLERFPRCEVVALSHSKTQRTHLEAVAAARGLASRLEVVTQDVNAFAPPGTFDRVASVEMFEHVADPEALLTRVAGVLRPGGRMFVHVFAHRRSAWRATRSRTTGPATGWPATTSPAGGCPHTTRSRGSRRRCVPSGPSGSRGRTTRGRHGRGSTTSTRTAALVPVFEATYGAGEARRWHARWRAFFLACEVCFGWAGGDTWGVSHHVLAGPR